LPQHPCSKRRITSTMSQDTGKQVLSPAVQPVVEHATNHAGQPLLVF
jgi:hypothetical protein